MEDIAIAILAIAILLSFYAIGVFAYLHYSKSTSESSNKQQIKNNVVTPPAPSYSSYGNALTNEVTPASMSHFVKSSTRKYSSVPISGLTHNDFELNVVDKYSSFDDLQRALRTCGLEAASLIIGIDFTKSNEWTGANSFNGKHLHSIDPKGEILNPYQQVIETMGKCLEVFR